MNSLLDISDFLRGHSSSLRGIGLSAERPSNSEVRTVPEVASTLTLVRGGAVAVVGIALALLLQSVFHIVVARILGPGGYSLLASQLTIVLIATPAAAALQAALAHEIAWRIEREGGAAVGLVLRDTLLALARRLAAIFVALLPAGLVAALLVDVRHPLPVLATIATVVGMLALSLALGGLQGLGRFGEVSAAQCGFGILKLSAGIILGLLGFAAGGVMLGIAVSVWLAAAVAALPLRYFWHLGRVLRSRPRRILRGFAGGPALVLTLLATLTSMGVLVARLSFSPDRSGAYAAVSFGAYSLLVIALTVSTLLYPRVDAGPVERPVIGNLVAVALLGMAGTTLLFAFPEPIVRLAFGGEYLVAAPWLGPLGIAMTLFALGNVYISHFLALGQPRFIPALCGLLVLELVLFAGFHSTPGDLIGVLIATAALLLAGAVLFERRLRARGIPAGTFEEAEPFVPLRTPKPTRDLAEASEEVTVVIPAYDEASRIESTLRRTAACLEAFNCDFELLVVDDGSRDGTRDVSERVARELGRVRVTGYEHNAGKGHAIVCGARAARGDLVMFVDADLEVHPRQLELLYMTMQEANADVVIGSKMHRESQVDYPRKRQIMSWGYYAIVRFCFGLPVRDTQTGLKLFRKEVLDGVASRMLVKRFAFDLEALVIAQRLGSRVVEAPVVVTRERALPKIGWVDAAHTAWDTAAVWYRTYLRRYYDDPDSVAGS